MQQRHGPDKFAVVLLSVDPEYFGKDNSYIARASKLFEKQKLNWPNAFLPGGWADVMHTFNLSGYGNIVVDDKGIVRGINVHGEALENLARRLTGAAAGPATRCQAVARRRLSNLNGWSGWLHVARSVRQVTVAPTPLRTVSSVR